MKIRVNHDYHIIELNHRTIPDGIWEWCHEQFGPADGSRWFYKHPKIYFVESKDHLMTLLRFSK